jgi:hypothetical protein
MSAAGWEETRECDHQIAIGSEGADTATRTWHGTRETSSVAGCRLTCTSIRVKNQGGMSYHLMQRSDTGVRQWLFAACWPGRAYQSDRKVGTTTL